MVNVVVTYLVTNPPDETLGENSGKIYNYTYDIQTTRQKSGGSFSLNLQLNALRSIHVSNGKWHRDSAHKRRFIGNERRRRRKMIR